MTHDLIMTYAPSHKAANGFMVIINCSQARVIYVSDAISDVMQEAPVSVWVCVCGCACVGVHVGMCSVCMCGCACVWCACGVCI